jgi:hypothetical protein
LSKLIFKFDKLAHSQASPHPASPFERYEGSFPFEVRNTSHQNDDPFSQEAHEHSVFHEGPLNELLRPKTGFPLRWERRWSDFSRLGCCCPPSSKQKAL